MYVCMLCMYACIYVYMYVCMYVCMYAMYVCMLCMYVCCVCMYVCMYVCMCVCVYVCTCCTLLHTVSVAYGVCKYTPYTTQKLVHNSNHRYITPIVFTGQGRHAVSTGGHGEGGQNSETKGPFKYACKPSIPLQSTCLWYINLWVAI